MEIFMEIFPGLPRTHTGFAFYQAQAWKQTNLTAGSCTKYAVET